MGTWGYSSFHNDTALDWLGDVLEADDSSLVGRALEVNAAPCASAACEAIAAAELVASAGGEPPKRLPIGVAEWLSTSPALPSVDVALRAVTHVRGHSELRERRAVGDGDLDAWLAELDELLARLRSVADRSR